jgi:chromosome partitioning protein
MRMLQWFKRKAVPVPRAQLVETENRPPSSEEKLERLVGRFARDASRVTEHVAGLPQMHVIVVASQKGGVGKTTLAAHLAVHASIVGEGPAALVDTDPQGSLSEWWDARKDEHERNEDGLALARTKLDDLPTRLAELRRNGVAVAIIDTPPAITASIKRVIEIADFVVIPARPSPHDLRAIAATVDLSRGAGKPFLFVVNGATPRANITAQAVAALSEHGQVAPVILYQRTEFAASMIDGRTVMETTPTGRSAQEIAELWKCVSAQMSLRAAA